MPQEKDPEDDRVTLVGDQRHRVRQNDQLADIARRIALLVAVDPDDPVALAAAHAEWGRRLGGETREAFKERLEKLQVELLDIYLKFQRRGRTQSQG